MKRKHLDKCDIKYTVVETTEADATYVDFMPHVWIVPTTNNSEVKERDYIQFYFPRRLPSQTKEKYLKFLKHAKFICMKPEDDGKWELKQGRILKLGLVTLEEALSSQKLYSDYFSTTEAELEIQVPAPAPKKCVRKKKKTLPEMNNDSESDDENREVASISNYNVRYATETQDMFTLDQGNSILPINYNDLLDTSLFDVDGRPTQSHIQPAEVLTLDGIFDEPCNEMFVRIQVPTNQGNNDVAEGIEIDQQMESTATDNGQQNNCSQSSYCKGHQKVLNKIDYFQKKTSKDIALLRQEITSNRKLLLELLNSRPQSEKDTEDNQNQQIENFQDEQAQMDIVEVDSFNEKYKEIFPIKNSEILIDFNNSMKNDQKFVDNVFAKLKQIKGDNEIKTTRKILKELFDYRCLKDFTWQGTAKQGTEKMKSFEKLHLVVDMITRLLTANYPGCQALNILMQVVKQRTKSAKESFVKLLASAAQVQDSVQAEEINKMNDSTMTTDHEIVVSTKNDALKNQHDTGSSCSEVINEISGGM